MRTWLASLLVFLWPVPGMAGKRKPASEEKDESAPFFFLLVMLTCVILPWTFVVLRRLLFPGSAAIQKAFPTKTENDKNVRQCQTRAMVEKREAQIRQYRSRWPIFTKGFVFRLVVLMVLWCWLIYIVLQVRQIAATSSLYQNFDPHSILGVDSSTAISEIKKAYRKKAKQYHPDVNPEPNAAEKFQLVKKAYDVLTDPVAARNYERWGNPDGPSRVEISCALPTISQEQQGIVLVAFVILFVLGVPVSLLCCLGSSSSRRRNGVLEETLEALQEGMKKNMSVMDIQELLMKGSDLEERVEPLPKREGESEGLERLRKALAGAAKVQGKSKLLLLMHLQRKQSLVEGTDVLNMDLMKVLPLWRSIVAALMQMAAALRCPKTLVATIEMHQCLVQALDPTSINSAATLLMQVPHITAEHVQQLRKGASKVASLQSLLELPLEERHRRLQTVGLEPASLADIDDFASFLPRVSMTARVYVDGEDEICEGDTATLEVELCRENLQQGEAIGAAHAPRYPDASLRETWWALFSLSGGGKELKNVIGQTRSEEREVAMKLRFIVPRIGKLRGKLRLICATYAGLDIEQDVTFEAKKAPDGAAACDRSTDDEIEFDDGSD